MKLTLNKIFISISLQGFLIYLFYILFSLCSTMRKTKTKGCMDTLHNKVLLLLTTLVNELTTNNPSTACLNLC